jgi:hypothetical protein
MVGMASEIWYATRCMCAFDAKRKNRYLRYTRHMRFLLTLLLALAMTVNAYATSTARARACCASDDCSVIQCLEMGCLPAASPMAAHRLLPFQEQELVRDVPLEIARSLPTIYVEIWTPPD